LAGGARPGAGRKRSAPQLKVIQGTFRKDRDAKEPEVPLGPMVAPMHLSGIACGHFASIAKLLEQQKRSSPHYTETVALLAQRLEQVQRFQAQLETEGDTYESHTKFGKIVRARPEVAMLSDAMRQAQSLLGDLMLSPSTALKIAQGAKQEANPFDDL
jgi:phage terminase small subunit